MVFSPDGRTLAAGSADGTVRLWDMTDRHRPRPLGPPMAGPRGYVYAVAFSPDGRTLATANTDKTAWLWSVADRSHPQPIGVLTGPAKTVFTVAFSPDGSLLAAGGQDQTVRIWHLDADAVAAHICATAGTSITPAEWHQYVGDTTYKPPCPN